MRLKPQSLIIKGEQKCAGLFALRKKMERGLYMSTEYSFRKESIYNDDPEPEYFDEIEKPYPDGSLKNECWKNDFKYNTDENDDKQTYDD